MDEFFGAESLRDRLIIAGIDEIGQYGIAGFSLRRVAAACGTSCAAPYKHFKNKDELIFEIIRYIGRQWELLRDQIFALHGSDLALCIVEISVAYIRFWVANPNYRFALKSSGDVFSAEKLTDKPDDPRMIENLIRAHCLSLSCPEEETLRRIYAVKALLYGMTAMLDGGELENSPKTYEYIRKTLKTELGI